MKVTLAAIALLGLFAWTRGGSAAEGDDLAPRPPLLLSSPRSFGRTDRPVRPRNLLGLGAGYLFGPAAGGVEEEQGALGVVLVGALGPAGAFLETTLLFDRAVTEGIYGRGEGSARGAGDLVFGAGAALRRFAPRGLPLDVGVSATASAPTGDERAAVFATPVVPAPPHRFAAKRWTASAGGRASLSTPFGLHVQASLDLLLHVHARPIDATPESRSFAIFAAPSVSFALRHPRAPFIVPLFEVDLDLELVGKSQLRQLVFLRPGVRLRAHPRLSLEVGARIPVREESRSEARAQLGILLEIPLGPDGDSPYALPHGGGSR
jgi:hypothetical protein